jgi:uncharacterized membrane protein YhdT
LIGLARLFRVACVTLPCLAVAVLAYAVAVVWLRV